MASGEANQMLAAAVAACEDKKGEDIRILALDPAESGLSDYFLLCTGTNDRQTVAITDEIELRLKRDFGTYPNAVEGRRQGEWILMDYVDFIVHVFLPEKRAYYGLERLRPSATSLSVDELNADIKAAITAKRPAKAARKATPATKAPAAPGATVKRRASAEKSAAKSAGGRSAPAKKTARKSSSKSGGAKRRTPRVADASSES